MAKHRVGRPNSYQIHSQCQVNDYAIELTMADVLDLLTRTSDATVNVNGE